MNISELSLFLCYRTSHDFPNARNPKCAAVAFNIVKSFCTLVPVINTIFAIVLISSIAIAKKRGEHVPDLNQKIILCSFCILSLGILLIPLMIKGTLLNMQRHAPPLENRNVKEIPADYLL